MRRTKNLKDFVDAINNAIIAEGASLPMTGASDDDFYTSSEEDSASDALVG